MSVCVVDPVGDVPQRSVEPMNDPRILGSKKMRGVQNRYYLGTRERHEIFSFMGVLDIERRVKVWPMDNSYTVKFTFEI